MARLIENANLSVETIEYKSISYGGGGWTLTDDWLDNWAWQDGIFSEPELDSIIEIGRDVGMFPGSTFGGSSKEIRDSNISFIYPNDMTSWIFARLAMAIDHVNGRYFGFDLTGMNQGLQFTEYTAPGEHYDWHIDRGIGSGSRKLSMAMQLTDPESYEGGELELWFGGKPVEMTRARGRAFFFPSYTMHRVKPVTKGVRHSLVCWISGPKFK